MLQHRFAELIDQLVRRIKRRGRALSDIGDARTSEYSFLLVARGYQIDAIELDAAAIDSATGFSVTHGGDADGGLAGTGLTDQAEHFATVQGEIDTLDNLMPAIFAKAFDPEIADFE